MLPLTALLAMLLAFAPNRALAGDCSQQFDSTFEAIQKRIFETHSCTAYPCHDNGAAARRSRPASSSIV